MGRNIRGGDEVIVIAGRDRGKQGRVLRVLPGGQRVIVEGVQRVTKHTKPRQTKDGATPGGIETVEAPIHVSNVQLVDPETKRGTRVGHRVEQKKLSDGRTKTVRVRVSRRSGSDIEDKKKDQ